MFPFARVDVPEQAEGEPLAHFVKSTHSLGNLLVLPTPIRYLTKLLLHIAGPFALQAVGKSG